MAESTAARGTADNDISVGTATADNKPITNTGEEREYVVKFLFRPKEGENNTEVARTHYAVLCGICRYYPTSTVFDNFGQPINEFTLDSYDDYLRHFKLHYVKANTDKKRRAIYLAFHRLRCTVPLSEIQKHSTISALLQRVNIRMSVHHWTEDESRIADLGFFVKLDPVNVLPDELTARVRQSISFATKRPVKKIPKFTCVRSSPYLFDEMGIRTATKSYDLQCRQADAKELLGLLQKTYQSDPVFIFHKMRHTNHSFYRSSLRTQNAFLAKCSVIPVQGITEELMFYLKQPMIHTFQGITDITQHKLTATTGWWNIITTATHFKTLLADIEDRLGSLAIAVAGDNRLDLNSLEEPTLAFKSTRGDDDASDGTFQSYVSACSTIYATTEEANRDYDEDDVYGQPPTSTLPPAQAWTTPVIPGVVATEPASDVDSPITQDAFDKVSRENARLTRVV